MFVEDRAELIADTIEDLEDDAFRRKGPLNRAAVDTFYLKRGLRPEEAVEVEKALAEAGVSIADADPLDNEGGSLPKDQTGLAGSALDYLVRAARKMPFLTQQQEIECADAIEQAGSLAEDTDDPVSERIRARGEAAKALLVTRNIRLVVKMAFDYRLGGRLDTEDLVQMGLIGLMRAAEKFDPSWETKFSTYASWWIRQAMSRGLADHGTTIRIPVHMRSLISKYRRARRVLESQGRTANVKAVAEKLGWTDEYAAKVATFAEQRTVSLDAPIGGDEGSTIKDMIVDVGRDPEKMLIDRDLADGVKDLLSELEDERLVDIVTRRFGLEGDEETLQEIGDDYGVTRERIRQLEDRAIRLLRRRALNARLISRTERTQA